MFDKIIDNLSKNELKQLIVLGRARLQKLQHDNDVSKIPAKTLNKMIEQAEPLYRGKFLEVSIPAYAVLELNIEDQEATYSMIDDYIDYKSIDSSIEESEAVGTALDQMQQNWDDLNKKVQKSAKKHDIDPNVIWEYIEDNVYH